ncbi:MAG: hypothetical protein FWH27_12245 [Planctomycetaceae bacterium]|nr:hypothetical protein [Planctomycetaceae bacterium]
MSHPSSSQNEQTNEPVTFDRRQLLGHAILGGIGGRVLGSMVGREEQILAQELARDESCTPGRTDSYSDGYPRPADWAKLADLKEKVPMSKIGNVEISRMILGGNLIGGWAHARDLIYVSDLVRAYHTKEKIYETFQLAEACGINTFLTTPGIGRMLTAYREQTGGKMQLISDTGMGEKLADDGVKFSIDSGASLIYMIGEATDVFLREGQFDLVGKFLQRVRDEGYPAGIGAHRIEACKKCLELGFVPDFWVKTYHHHNYWSASPGGQEHDNVFCRRPEETEEFMLARPEPWIAFKTLAAGSLLPPDGFRFAFAGGADFICVGMYDFQIVEDVNICTGILKENLGRKRDWQTENIAIS